MTERRLGGGQARTLTSAAQYGYRHPDLPLHSARGRRRTTRVERHMVRGYPHHVLHLPRPLDLRDTAHGDGISVSSGTPPGSGTSARPLNLNTSQ